MCAMTVGRRCAKPVRISTQTWKRSHFAKRFPFDNISNALNKLGQRCDVHRQDIQSYCSSCKVAACLECTTTEHADHVIRVFSESQDVRSLKEELTRRVRRTSEELEETNPPRERPGQAFERFHQKHQTH